MPKRSIMLSIPEPCHQSWDEMHPVPGGRHCGSCRKRVIDFTGMSDAEIGRVLAMHDGPVCGRLSVQQLGRDLEAVPESWRWKGFAAGLALAAGISANAPPTSAQVSKPVLSLTGMTPGAESGPSESRLQRQNLAFEISGHVVDALGAPVRYARIVLQTRESGEHWWAASLTDEDGRYKLKVSGPDMGYQAVWLQIYLGDELVQTLHLGKIDAPLCIETRLDRTNTEINLKTLVGKVVDQSGFPLSNVYAELCAGNTVVGREVTDFDGQFTIRYRPQGPDNIPLTVVLKYQGYDTNYSCIPGNTDTLTLSEPLTLRAVVMGEFKGDLIVIRRRAGFKTIVVRKLKYLFRRSVHFEHGR